MSDDTLHPGQVPQLPRRAVARPVGPTAAVITMWFGERGPWSVVADLPLPGSEPIGPPPGFLALAGWGC